MRKPSLGPDETEELVQRQAGLNIRTHAAQSRAGLQQLQVPVQGHVKREGRCELFRRQTDLGKRWVVHAIQAAWAPPHATSKTS